MGSIKTLNPTTGKIEKEFKEFSISEIQEKIGQANLTFKHWKQESIEKRIEALRKIAFLFREEKEEMAKIAAVEMGKLLKEGIVEVELCAKIFDYYAEYAKEFLADKPLQPINGKAFIAYEPIGVILSIQPWNFPYSQVIRNVAPNIVSGNTVVVKHSSSVPQCALKIEELFKKAGFPQGVYTNIFMPGTLISTLINDPIIQGVTITGSKFSGQDIAAAAGKNTIKSVLELGGSDPFIVLEDANLDEVIKLAGPGRLKNAGQVCVAPKRMIIVESLYDAFLDKIREYCSNLVIGDPLDSKTELGPLSSEKSLNTVLKQVEKAVKQGAKLHYGGKKLERDGFFMEPTILTHVTNNIDAYKEEFFGPVFIIFKVRNVEEAVKLANDTPFGLGATICSENKEKAVQIARLIESGMVGINTIVASIPELPFGGIKQSGYGRELSSLGIYEFLNQKMIHVI